MAARRWLIVNADDFGLSPGVNRGVIAAHEHGVVTSASLMVREPAAAAAAAYARGRPGFSLGLHFDFGEWVCRGGVWAPRYLVVPPDDAAAVAAEAARQLEAFRALVGADPTHLDSHQHAHRQGPARSALVALADRLGIPLRQCHPAVSYCGDFYGQDAEGAPYPEIVTVAGLLRVLAALPPGLTELGCHPGEDDLPGTAYNRERGAEVGVLCDPRVRAALAELGVQLCTFRDVPRVGGKE
jgi:predicted glycoside hydrolase/deacetylase ChbG (UPF0249 family)